MLTAGLFDSNGKCLLSYVDIFLFLLSSCFPYTGKLTFILDYAPLFFSFCYPRNNF